MRPNHGLSAAGLGSFPGGNAAEHRGSAPCPTPVESSSEMLGSETPTQTANCLVQEPISGSSQTMDGKAIMTRQAIVLGISAVILVSGCRMCASPFDYSGPTAPEAVENEHSHSRSRAGSLFAPHPQDVSMDEHMLLGGEVEEDAVLGDVQPAPAPEPALVGARSTERPHIDFGVPPEHIISITDRLANDSGASGAKSSPSPEVVADDPQQATETVDPPAGDGWSARPVSRRSGD